MINTRNYLSNKETLYSFMYLRAIEIFKRIDSINKLQKAMGLKEKIVKEILEAKLNKATEFGSNYIQKLQQKLDELLSKDKD